MGCNLYLVIYLGHLLFVIRIDLPLSLSHSSVQLDGKAILLQYGDHIFIKYVFVVLLWQVKGVVYRESYF